VLVLLCFWREASPAPPWSARTSTVRTAILAARLHGVQKRRTNESSTLRFWQQDVRLPDRAGRPRGMKAGHYCAVAAQDAGSGVAAWTAGDRDPVAAASPSNLSVATVRRNLPSPMERIGGVGGRGRAGQERRVAVCHAPWRTGTRSSARASGRWGAARRHGHRDRRLGPMGGVDSIASRRDGWAAAEGHQARGGCRFDRRW